MNIKYLVKDGSGDLYVPIYPFHQETYELAGGGPGSGSLVNKKLRIAVTVNIADESVTYTLLNYNYFAFISEIEIQGERHTFPITGQDPFTWQFDKPGEYTFYVTFRSGSLGNSGSPVFTNIQNAITSVSLPYGIETLPPAFFAGMNMPNVDIILPSSIKYLGVGDGQFNNCILHKLVIPKNCIVNGGTLLSCAPEILEFHGTFIDAKTVPFGLSSYYLNINSSRLKKLVIDCRNTQIVQCYGLLACEEIEVSGNVETILGGCFNGCSLVKKVTLFGNKLKEIQGGAFGGCSSLVDISIADSVENIQPSAFGGCTSLKYIKLPSSLKVLKSGVFNGNGLPLETVVLPEGLEEILGNAFAGISTLKDINIPSKITAIPVNCFAGSGLLNIDIPNSVLRIESAAFASSGLTEIIIPTSVKFIGSSAFSRCPATKVYIPNTLETVQDGAFSLYNTSYSNNTLTELYVDTDLVAGTNLTGYAQTTNLLFPVIFGNVGYNALERVELGPHVTRIGDYAFYYSERNDREIIFGDSVKEIGSYAFAHSGLVNELDLSHIERIEDNAFLQFNFKYSDVILHNIKTIENWAFRYANYINTLEISTEDKTLTESDIDIGYNAFGDCGIYDKLIVDIPVKFDTTSFLNPIVLSTGNYSHYKTLYLGDLVYNQIFSPSRYISSPSTIENVYFGKNIEYIPTRMFDNHSNLKTVKLHAKKIDYSVFANCSNLESVEGLDSICYFGNDCFSGCIKLNLGHITVPSVQEGGYIGSGAFNYTKIISLTNNYEHVNTSQYGFVYNCSDLVTVVNNATTGCTTAEILGYGRTQYNTSLKQVVTNDKSLAYLSNFPALETIVMSNPEVTFNLGNGNVFNNSPKLKDIYIYNRIAPSLGSSTFIGCAENVKVHVPANATGYEAWVDGSTVWYKPYQLHWEIVKDLDPVYEKLVVYHDIQNISAPTTILTNNDGSVKSINIDDKETISEIPLGNVTYLFDTVGLHVIKVEFNDPTVVGNSAPLFQGLTTVKRVVIPDTFVTIGTLAFAGCTGLANVTIGNGVTNIGPNAFASCTELTSVTMGNNVTTIGANAFGICTNLTSITIPNSVTSIGNNAFYGTEALETLNYNAQCELNTSFRSRWSNLETVVIGDSTPAIGSSVFSSCSSLTSVTIGSGVTSIGAGAFAGCSNLSTITSHITNAPSLADGTFQSVKTGGTLYVPTSSSGYDTWMNNRGNLGAYNWTKVEQ